MTYEELKEIYQDKINNSDTKGVLELLTFDNVSVVYSHNSQTLSIAPPLQQDSTVENVDKYLNLTSQIEGYFSSSGGSTKVVGGAGMVIGNLSKKVIGQPAGSTVSLDNQISSLFVSDNIYLYSWIGSWYETMIDSSVEVLENQEQLDSKTNSELRKIAAASFISIYKSILE